MTSTVFSSFERAYGVDVLGEIPGDGQIHYFPEARSESPLMVRFTLPDGSSWSGGFGAGALAVRACTGVFASPSLDRACVVSRGRVYAVDIAEPRTTTVVLPELVMQVVPDVSAGVLLLADPWQLHAYGADGLQWSTDRIAIEGFTILAADDRMVVVRVEDADGEFEELRIDVRTGRSS